MVSPPDQLDHRRQIVQRRRHQGEAQGSAPRRGDDPPAPGGQGGQTSDVLIHARHLEKCRETLTGLLAERTGQSREKLAAGMERDCFLDAQEALDYGLVDQVL
jgi:hypothetical protein